MEHSIIKLPKTHRTTNTITNAEKSTCKKMNGATAADIENSIRRTMKTAKTFSWTGRKNRIF
jgi:hypothetical protein